MGFWSKALRAGKTALKPSWNPLKQAGVSMNPLKPLGEHPLGARAQALTNVLAPGLGGAAGTPGQPLPPPVQPGPVAPYGPGSGADANLMPVGPGMDGPPVTALPGAAGPQVPVGITGPISKLPGGIPTRGTQLPMADTEQRQ